MSRRPRSGPVDPRLLHELGSLRLWLAASGLLGLVLTATLVVQASFLAQALSAAMHRDTSAVATALAGLVAATVVRALFVGGGEVAAAVASGQARSDLRLRVLARLIGRPGCGTDDQSVGTLAVAIGHGLDALDVYIGRYLPRLVTAVLAPVVLMVWVAHLDLLSAGILGFTILLIPVFMILIGQLTAERVAARWEALACLSGHFLDTLEGLPILKAFGRARTQRRAIAAATERLRVTTLATLKTAFLSSLVLETLAALGTALVAVPLGLRLVAGHMSLAPALTILILTPEVYLPLRRAAAEFHASADGTAATSALLDLLDTSEHGPAELAVTGLRERALVPTGREPQAGNDIPLLTLDGVSVSFPGRSEVSLSPTDLEIGAAEHVAVIGPSGTGKSTLALVAAGLLVPTTGAVLVEGRRLVAEGLDEWRSRVAWVPQRPTLFSGTVADNLRLAAPEAGEADLWAALERAALADVVSALPGGLDASVGERAAMLSAGERQRLGLARALVRASADLVVLDEPTAHLDLSTERAVVHHLHVALRDQAALIISHRSAPLGLAERTVNLGPQLVRQSLLEGAS